MTFVPKPIPIRNKRLDFLLVQCPEVDYDSNKLSLSILNIFLEIPIGLSYIAAVLEREHYSVRILDLDALRMGGKKFIQYVKILRPRIIGFNVTTTLFKISEKLAKMAKIASPSSLIICGGPQPTINPVICLKNGVFDLAVRGEGELTVVEIAQRFIGDPLNPYDLKPIGSEVGNEIRGVSYIADEKLINEPERELITNLDDLPFPSRHLLSQQLYFHAIGKSVPHTSIIMMRGCPYSCLFCFKIFNQVRCRSVKNVVDEIESAVKFYGIHNFSFVDAQLNLYPQTLARLCIEILRRGLKINFRFIGRVNEKLMPHYLIYLLKLAGCYQIAFGIESLQQKTLDFLRKGYSVNDIIKTITAVQLAGIEVQGYYIFGIPIERIKDMYETIKSARNLGTLFISYTILVPFPGTLLWELSKRNKWFDLSNPFYANYLENDLNCFDALNAKRAYLTGPDWDPKAIENFVRNIIRLYYINPKMIIKVIQWVFRNFIRLVNRFVLIIQRIL